MTIYSVHSLVMFQSEKAIFYFGLFYSIKITQGHYPSMFPHKILSDLKHKNKYYRNW